MVDPDLRTEYLQHDPHARSGLRVTDAPKEEPMSSR